VVMTDITDSAELRGKLVHAEKMAAVGQLVSGVAHVVNNPLTAILGFADLLLENPDLPPTALKDLRVILQEAQRTKQIVQNLLSFARQMPPQRNAVQLNLILRRTIQLRSYDFNSHGVDIVEHLDEGLPDVIGDAHQLQQVFLNILNNAYDAVHEVGRPARIEIVTTKVGDAVEISFRDNGYGISHPDRIFDPFFTTKEVGKGTGLGLSICYGIMKEHGGEILCHNNMDGEGATFIVRFSVMTTPALQPAVTLPVLLIEDEPSIMALVSATLERSGYEVVCIESGAEALRLLEKGQFLGVISDMRTPGGVDGAQVHSWISTNRPDLIQKVVIITGDYANEETVTTLRNIGARYLEKPFRVQDLISAVEKTMGRAR
jgi:two-component system NtrC family sensor kinase